MVYCDSRAKRYWVPFLLLPTFLRPSAILKFVRSLEKNNHSTAVIIDLISKVLGQANSVRAFKDSHTKVKIQLNSIGATLSLVIHEFMIYGAVIFLLVRPIIK